MPMKRQGSPVRHGLHAGLRRAFERPLDEQQAGARIAKSIRTEEEPAGFRSVEAFFARGTGWESPWGQEGVDSRRLDRKPKRAGRAGASVLGHVLGLSRRDLRYYGGGLGLIFPHHERDCPVALCTRHVRHGQLLDAQRLPAGRRARCRRASATSSPSANYWKPIASSGALAGRGAAAAMLMTHYREPIDFAVRKLEEAENTLRKWKRRRSGFPLPP